jgi:hypothetical protein
MDDRKVIRVEIDPDVAAALEREAVAEGRSVADLVNDMLRLRLAEDELNGAAAAARSEGHHVALAEVTADLKRRGRL